MALLEVQHVSKQLHGGLLIDDISFEQKALQKIAITGESGAGKTTLLKMVSGHAQPDSGTILFNGKRVPGPEEKLLPGHKEIAYLSQEHDLLHNYKVEDLIWFGNKLSDEEAARLFEICRVVPFMKRKTDQLSGGEKQRIALCMLLIKSPKMLIMDEPFSNLDPIHTGMLKSVLEDITEQLQISCMLTSHDPNDTLSWADEIIVMRKGKIVQQNTPEIIYNQPLDEYVAGMFGDYNLLTPGQAALFGIEANGENVMIRPEDFCISADPDNGVKATMKKIKFWGGFYEAVATIGDLNISVRVTNDDYEIGQEIFVAVKKKQFIS